jgi:hypothetical protein
LMADGRAVAPSWARRSSARVGHRWAERADDQVDVAISLMTTARYAGYAGNTERALLERAASILHTLDAEGRLEPADRGKIDAVARVLATLQ